ncbi:hypothetical protein [Peribacillus sp. Hz7]
MEKFEQFNKSFIDGEWTEGKTGRTVEDRGIHTINRLLQRLV